MQQDHRSSLLERINDLWWLRLPAMIGRLSRTLSAVLADGMYCSAWSVGAFVLPIMFVFGFLLAWLQAFFGEVYTFSILLMAALVLMSHLGAALGASMWLGYVLGDLLLFVLIPVLTSQQPFPPERIFLIVVTRFLADLLLANLLVVIPLAIRGLTRLTMWRIRSFANTFLKRGQSSAGAVMQKRSPAQRSIEILLDIPVQFLLAIVLVYLWTQAVATLIRPVYTWHDSSPPIEAIQPLQSLGWLLAILAGCVGVVRIVLEAITANKPPLVARQIGLYQAMGRSKSRHPLLVGLVLAPFKAALLTFLLAGILDSWLQAIILAVILGVIFLIRAIFAEFLSVWTRIVSYVPIAIRFLLALGLSYLLSWPIMQVLWNQTSTFLPVLIGTVISLVVFSILLPARESATVGASGQAQEKQ